MVEVEAPPSRDDENETVERGALVLLLDDAAAVGPREPGHLGRMNFDPREEVDHQTLYIQFTEKSPELSTSK